MVNPGHRSNGCATCKIRHVKCDEMAPACLRCTKSKRICLGYELQSRGARRHGGKAESALLQRSEPRLDQRSSVVGIAYCAWTKAISTVNFGVHSGIIDQRSLLRSLLDFSIVLPDGSCSDRAPLYVLDAVSAGFRSLQEPTQTMETRRKLHEKYQLAIRKLREGLSLLSVPAHSSAICLLASYEVGEPVSRHDGKHN